MGSLTHVHFTCARVAGADFAPPNAYFGALRNTLIGRRAIQIAPRTRPGYSGTMETLYSAEIGENVSENTVMTPAQGSWDYLVVTASNDLQAEAYRSQIELRRSIGQLTQASNAMVVADLEGRRIGSGGSTIECLRQVVAREQLATPSDSPDAILRRLRVLILHAGGDSRRLPAYSPCGKLFVPLPGESYSALGLTLFDRLAPSFLALPRGGDGQIVIAAGDALIDFDSSGLNFSAAGITALGAFTTPEEASRHGVFCPGPRGSIRLFMQKPSLAEQAAAGALNRRKQAVLDVGIMSLDASAGAQLLGVFCDPETLAWRPRVKQAMLAAGIDLYREICCALGTDATEAHYFAEVRRSGGTMEDSILAEFFQGLRAIPLNLQILERCSFLHFGATRQLITNGIALLAHDDGNAPEETALSINNALEPGGVVEGSDSWIEGCRIAAPLGLTRRNVLTGVDLLTPLELPEGACIDVSEGADRNGSRVRFVRCYGVGDTFKNSVDKGATFCGMPLSRWMEAVGVTASDVWPDSVPFSERTLWNARMFPPERLTADPEPFRRWLWFFHPHHATKQTGINSWPRTGTAQPTSPSWWTRKPSMLAAPPLVPTRSSGRFPRSFARTVASQRAILRLRSSVRPTAAAWLRGSWIWLRNTWSRNSPPATRTAPTLATPESCTQSARRWIS